MSLIIDDLSFTYPHNQDSTLKNVSFKVEEGKITTLIGPNGSGKTTLIKCLTSDSKYKGTISLNKEDFLRMDRRKKMRLVGYLPQASSSYCSLSVFEVILLGKLLDLRFKPSKQDLEEVSKLIDDLNLSEIALKPYDELSGGQQRMVNIGQVLIKKPSVLILDEPTSNLDISNELEVIDLISQYTQKKNTITLLVLHSLNIASRFSSQIILLDKGKVFSSGTPHEVITKDNIQKTYKAKVDVYLSDDGHTTLHLIESANKKEYNFGE